MEYVYGIIIIAIIIYVVYSRTPNAKGRRLESYIHWQLKRYAKKTGGFEFRDLMVKDDKASSQIDNLIITSKAIYVIEAKNYNGHIFGSAHQEKWILTVRHENTKRTKSGRSYKKTHISKHSFYNPVKQNQTHIHKIKKIVMSDLSLPIYNVVVFGFKAFLRDVEENQEYKVINANKLYSFIRKQDSTLPEIISQELIADIVDRLYFHNIVDKKERRLHVSNIKRKYQS